jgi:hypothetical protein
MVGASVIAADHPLGPRGVGPQRNAVLGTLVALA